MDLKSPPIPFASPNLRVVAVENDVGKAKTSWEVLPGTAEADILDRAILTGIYRRIEDKGVDPQNEIGPTIRALRRGYKARLRGEKVDPVLFTGTAADVALSGLAALRVEAEETQDMFKHNNNPAAEEHLKVDAEHRQEVAAQADWVEGVILEQKAAIQAMRPEAPEALAHIHRGG